jgi:hypothetical protein
MVQRTNRKSGRREAVALASLLEELRTSGRTTTMTEYEAFIYFSFVWDAATNGSGRSVKTRLAAGFARDLRDRLAPEGSALRIVIDRLYPLPEPKKSTRGKGKVVACGATEI